MRARGGICTPSDYEPLCYELAAGQQATLAASGGRSSNMHLPFFNVDAGERGLAVGIGWSGQWRAGFTADAEGRLRMQADIARTSLRLHPGEGIRTARILLVAWEGDRYAGHNQLRRLLYRHHTPLLDGRKPLPPTQCNTWFAVGDDGGKANAQNQIELLEAYAAIGIEYLVMDAGWYGTTPIWHLNVGTWTPRTDTFPQGLQPVGEATRRTGIQFGMWFEPERVVADSQLDCEHPEWLLRTEDQANANRLLNLGLPAAQQWFVEMVGSYVEGVPLGYFRHDFNMDPLPYWQAADAPERTGMCEIRYIEGLYHIWDTLHARYPALLMEGCASGGRRIDLESISRCHTYWKSDLYANLVANQGHTYGANLYLPGNYLNTPLFDLATDHYALHSIATGYGDEAARTFAQLAADCYAFRSQLGCALCLGWDPRRPDFDLALARARVKEFKARRHLSVGDFYPLLPYSLQPADWTGYQFHRADLDEGMVLLFRHHQSAQTQVEIRLHGLKSEALYEVTYEDTGERCCLSGQELASALRVKIGSVPGSALIGYKAQR